MSSLHFIKATLSFQNYYILVIFKQLKSEAFFVLEWNFCKVCKWLLFFLLNLFCVFPQKKETTKIFINTFVFCEKKEPNREPEKDIDSLPSIFKWRFVQFSWYSTLKILIYMHFYARFITPRKEAFCVCWWFTLNLFS